MGLFLGGCSLFDLVISYAPPFLYCGEKFVFQVEVRGLAKGDDVRWEALYGLIDQNGFYEAPLFPCFETVTVRGKRAVTSVHFEVREKPEEPHSVTSEEFSVEESYQFSLVWLPSCVNQRILDFCFFFQGKECVVFLNDEKVFQGGSIRGETFTLPLSLREGTNSVKVFTGGKEIFSRLVSCDTLPPEVKIERAQEGEGGIMLEGEVVDRDGDSARGGKKSREHWTLFVPWNEGVTMEWCDRAGNCTQEVFAVANDLQVHFLCPQEVKEGEEVSLEVGCFYRGIPIEDVRVHFLGEREETLTLPQGQGTIAWTFWGSGETQLFLRVGESLFSFPVSIFPQNANRIILQELGEILANREITVSGLVEDGDGKGCRRLELLTQIADKDGMVVFRGSCTTDDRGEFSFPISLSSVGRHTLTVQGGGKSVTQEFYVLPQVPLRINRLTPSSGSWGLVAGSEWDFRAQVVDERGKGVSGVKVSWRWERENGEPWTIEILSLRERTDFQGETCARFRLPTTVGRYSVILSLPYWNIQTSLWRIDIQAANVGKLLDETRLPHLLHPGEEITFTVRALDIYGNPVRNVSLSVYRGREGEELSRVMTARTQEDGRAHFSLSFPLSGTWYVRAYFQAWELQWMIDVQEG